MRLGFGVILLPIHHPFLVAERVATRALEFYRSHYQRTDDKDLQDNKKTLQKYRKIVRQRIERFRRL